jgi:hypothetical protein
MNSGRVFNVMDYGCAGDGVRLETDGIQQAIVACAEAGEGTVYFPPGQYITGTITLKSRVHMHLAPQAVIKGSDRLEDYDAGVPISVESSHHGCLLFAQDAEHVSITGQGTIDGNGGLSPFFSDSRVKQQRPMLIRMINCQQLVFRDVNLINAASWCTHLISCRQVVIDGVKLNSMVKPNNDGFDLDSCQDVFMSNCHIFSGDDSICLKSTTNVPCERIVVNNCIISSDTAAVKFGTSSKSGFRDITISNCVFYDCRLGAIKLLITDGGLMENVNISNIIMNNVEGPLFIRLGKRGHTYEKLQLSLHNGNPEERKIDVPTGTIRNVRISNITAKVKERPVPRRKADPKAMNGIMITGLPGHCIENVVLDNINITFPGGGTKEDAERVVAEDEYRYPEQSFFGILPSYALYIRHVKGIEVRNMSIGLDSLEERPAIHCEDVEQIDIHNIRFDQTPDSDSLIKLNKTRHASVSRVRFFSSVPTFVELDAESHDISLMHNDLRLTSMAVAHVDKEIKDRVLMQGNLGGRQR